MTNVRLSAEEQAEILKAIGIQIVASDGKGVTVNPAAFLRDAGLREARRIIAAHEKKSH